MSTVTGTDEYEYSDKCSDKCSDQYSDEYSAEPLISTFCCDSANAVVIQHILL